MNRNLSSQPKLDTRVIMSFAKRHQMGKIREDENMEDVSGSSEEEEKKVKIK